MANRYDETLNEGGKMFKVVVYGSDTPVSHHFDAEMQVVHFLEDITKHSIRELRVEYVPEIGGCE